MFLDGDSGTSALVTETCTEWRANAPWLRCKASSANWLTLTISVTQSTWRSSAAWRRYLDVVDMLAERLQFLKPGLLSFCKWPANWPR